MDEEIDKKLDRLTEKLIKNFSTETPSFDFTQQVLSKIEAIEIQQVYEYKPLISKKVWVVVFLGVLGVFSYLILGDAQVGNSWLTQMKPSFVSDITSFSLPDYRISNVFMYALVGFAFFVSIQTLFLKNHFDKQLA